MKALVIYTHPRRDSLNGAFLDAVLSGLRANPSVTDIAVEDLYTEGFDPRLVFDQTRRRRDLHKDPELTGHRDRLREADLVVFVYPLWWGRPPAMLMGYIDRLFAKDFAYRYRGGGPLPEGLLKGKRVVCVSTMKGFAGYPALFLGNAHRNLMRKAIFSFVGIRKVKFFEFGSMESPKGRQEEKIRRVTAWFRRLGSAAGRSRGAGRPRRIGGTASIPA